MHLTDLVPGPAAAHPDAGSIGMIDVTGISSDSRAIAPGHLFAALKGSSGDGRAYVAAAVEAGAAKDRVALVRAAELVSRDQQRDGS